MSDNQASIESIFRTLDSNPNMDLKPVGEGHLLLTISDGEQVLFTVDIMLQENEGILCRADNKLTGEILESTPEGVLSAIRAWAEGDPAS